MIRTVNIIIPVFNEKQNINPFFFELAKVTNRLKKYNFKYIFVDDGSTDNTVDEIKKLNNKEVFLIEFTRNFGKEAALTAGLVESPESDYYFTLDSDLQHPPEIIEEILKIKENDSDIKIIECIRKENKDNNFLRKIFNNFFYFIIRNFTNSNSSTNTTDYRFYDRQVIKHFKNLREKNRTVRFLVDWIGFKKKNVEFYANKRMYGSTKYEFSSLISLFVKTVTSFSTFPLKIILFFGTIVTILFFLLLAYMVFVKIFISDLLFSNLSFVIVLGTILLGIILTSIGLIGIYIGNIYKEVQNRPVYIKKEN